TYQPFSPDLPAPAPIEQPAPPGALDRCVIVTVTGLPGVLAFERRLDVGPQVIGTIGYAMPGSDEWQSFAWTSRALSSDPALPQNNGPLDPYAVYRDLALDGTAQASGGWLYVPVHQDNALPSMDIPQLMLVGTPDFGQTWYWVDAALYQQHGLSCGRI